MSARNFQLYLTYPRTNKNKAPVMFQITEVENTDIETSFNQVENNYNE